ncbi:MAG: hypothetical protein AABX11_05370 [Nanoarchaeota archaeon]
MKIFTIHPKTHKEYVTSLVTTSVLSLVAMIDIFSYVYLNYHNTQYQQISREVQAHYALPSSIKPYDKNGNGHFEANELRTLLKANGYD